MHIYKRRIEKVFIPGSSACRLCVISGYFFCGAPHNTPTRATLVPPPRPAAPWSPAQDPWQEVPSPPFPGTTWRYLALRPFLPQSPSPSSSRGSRPLTDPVSASSQSRFCVDVPRSPCLAAALTQEAGGWGQAWGSGWEPLPPGAVGVPAPHTLLLQRLVHPGDIPREQCGPKS